MFGNENFRAPKVSVHDFSMVPRPEIPRSTFRMQHQHKTTIPASTLIPVLCLEVLPGDTFNINMTAFCRVNTLLTPIMDNMDLESWFFFTPCRILWSHWVNFMGEQPVSPSDSISYTIPNITGVPTGATNCNIWDYFGIPISNMTANTVPINALPFRAYNITYNQWFRDQNLQGSFGTGATNTVGDIGDGPDPAANYALQLVGKRHDYFTSCLPWTQKGGVPISFLSGNAVVQTSASAVFTGAQSPLLFLTTAGSAPTTGVAASFTAGDALQTSTTAATGTGASLYPSNLIANLGSAAQNTINSLRLAFQTQKLLERDARSGTRYQELVLSHFGVQGHDSRYQRPEYQGGGKTPISISPIPQTAPQQASGVTTPQGNLAAIGTAVGHGHGMQGSYTEHGYLIGYVAVRSDEIYQQGLHRMWTRQTRYDFYWPVFSMIGEQAVRQDEIYATGVSATDTAAFGFQEAWASYRHIPSRTSGFFRSTGPTPIDFWHLAINFASPPALNAGFINSPLVQILKRNLSGGVSVQNEEFLCDLFFDIKAARPMPLYSVPGLIDHF